MAALPDDVGLWIGGDGPDSDRLRAEYGDDPRIEWLGRISDADKIARLRGADVFCAPSLHGEAFGVVLIEAMAASTTVVASGLDGYRNVATDDVDALLVPPGDAEALAAALSPRPRRRRPRRPAAHRGLASGPQRFSMTALAAAYVAIYRELIARSRWPSPGGCSAGLAAGQAAERRVAMRP